MEKEIDENDWKKKKYLIWQGGISFEKRCNVFHNHRCYRNATKDGYCWQHHPDKVAEREKLSKDIRKIKWENSPLNIAMRKIKELEEEIGILKSQLAICSYDSKKHKSYVKEQKRQINRGAVK
ncbi:hypothetical protein LCGC14_1636420 [marine sediment metagenome]|uniref:Uncharacterized protein n=1 Tax=marine sediment metagenome TaxID=412755 RepID=A0A0F9INB7_9ZZZZ